MKKTLYSILLVCLAFANLTAKVPPPPTVTVCHQAGGSCVTMTIPLASLAGHLSHGDYVGSCSGGQIYALASNSSILDFASIDVNTGAATVLSSTNVATTFKMGASTFDPINKSYFFTNSLIARPINQPPLIYQIDIPTLTITNTILSNDIIELEYDISNNTIWGLSSNAGLFDIVEINTGGIILNQFPTNATTIGEGTSTFDRTNRRYFFENSLSSRAFNDPITLYQINVSDPLNIIVNTSNPSKEIYELEYDENTGNIWGLMENLGVLDLVEIDVFGNFISTPIPVGAVCVDVGSSTFSQNNRKYFFKTTECSRVAPPARHYTIDVASGIVVSSVITGNTFEYEFYSCASACPTCKMANNEQDTEINLEYMDEQFTKNYPSSIKVSSQPFSGKVNFTYSLADNGNVTLEIFDITGKTVIKLINDGFYAAGLYEKIWSIENNIPSGLYFYKFKTSFLEINNKFVIVK